MSGNGSGIILSGLSNDPISRIIIQNNIIGLGADGTTLLSNADNGVDINHASSILIRDNVISGNTDDGVDIW